MHNENIITYQIYTSFEELIPFQEKWDKFLTTVEGDIYFTFDWCNVWWQFYGKNRVLKILVFYHESEIIGIIPIFWEILWLGPVWIKLAKLVGSDFTLIMANPPVNPDYADEIFKHLFEFVLVKEGCDAIWFGPIGGKYNALSNLRASMQQYSDLKPIQDRVMSPYTTFNLPNTFDEYIQSFAKKQRYNLQRIIKILNNSFQITHDIVQDEANAIKEFEKFIQMHNKQWEAVGKLGHFNDWPLGKEFNTKLVTEQVKSNRLRLLRLIADDKVVLYEFCFVFGKRLYWRLSARLSGPGWDRFSLGKIGLAKEIKMAISEGVNEIYAGAGHYDYKIELGGEEQPLYSILAAYNRLLIPLRVSLFLSLSKLLHFCYYRVWFNRLSFKIPFKRKPLWKLWIRTRL